MSAVDERGLKISDVDHMADIGPDQAKSAPIMNGTTINMRAHFGTAHGPAFQTGIQLAPQQPDLQQQQRGPQPHQPQPNQPQDLWAGTGHQRNPVLDGVDQISNNLSAGAPKGAKMDGAGYLANSVGAMAVELFGAITKPEPQAMDMQMQMNQPRPATFGL